MTHRPHRPARPLAAALLAAALAGCAPLEAPPARPRAAAPAGAAATAPDPVPLWLLGEVHDNPAAHARRLQWLQARLADGARPALLMEQFDRERQPAIDRLLATPVAPGTAAPGDAAEDPRLAPLVALGGRGWDWALYRPVLALALRHGLPLVAANLSREDARAVMRSGLADAGFDAALPAALQQAQAALIEASHCGQVDAALARRMVLAQVARDQFMARQLQAHAARGAVLLAGNGHVRRDLGVPRWLPPALAARARVVGFVEAGDALPAGAFDEHLRSPAAARADPCAAMPQPGTATAATAASAAAAVGASAAAGAAAAGPAGLASASAPSAASAPAATRPDRGG